jgi:argininosuccinate lyase
MVRTLTFNTARLEALAPMGYSLATDVAEWLVKKGVPFRVAHEITGELVKECESIGIELKDAPDELLAKVSTLLDGSVREVTSVGAAIAARDGAGGTALSQVLEQLLAIRKLAPRREA